MNYTTYEQAVKLKQLGFNEWCLAWYNETKLEIYESDVLLNKVLTDKNRVPLAPFVSQAINWFRKQKVYGYIHHSVASNSANQCTFTVCIDGEKTYCYRNMFTRFENCEEALLDYLLNNTKNF